jgi:phosphoribosyl-ATP pyrophosphohydrolase/phosphoribosyl-AMP cyclohydrolase
MKINFEKMGGLVPAVIQDSKSLEILMVGFMNQKAYQKTSETGLVTFYSRSKERLWTKGESSKNYLKVVSIKKDCDSDSLVIKAGPAGPTCHEGTKSCFFNLESLFELIESRKQNGDQKSYTSSLFKEGQKKILEKVAEESLEVKQAAEKEGKQRLIEESCDLLYHLFVLIVNEKISLAEIEGELKKRNQRQSSQDPKN